MEWIRLFCVLGLMGGLAGCMPSLEVMSAAHVGCKAADITISEESSEAIGGPMSGAMTSWVAHCEGRRFICTRTFSEGVDVSCTEAVTSQEQRTASQSTPPNGVDASSKVGVAPTGAAGFSFGDSVKTSQGACESAGHTWANLKPGRYRCSGAAKELGFEAPAVLEFCRGGVCAVTLVHRPKANWVESIAELKTTLQNKYGEALNKEVSAVETCSADGVFVECINNGHVRITYAWKWQTRERIELRVVEPDPERDSEVEAAIRIVYSKPNSIIKPDGLAL